MHRNRSRLPVLTPVHCRVCYFWDLMAVHSTLILSPARILFPFSSRTILSSQRPHLPHCLQGGSFSCLRSRSARNYRCKATFGFPYRSLSTARRTCTTYRTSFHETQPASSYYTYWFCPLSFVPTPFSVSFIAYPYLATHVSVISDTVSNRFSSSVLLFNFCKFSAQRGLRAETAAKILIQVTDKPFIAVTAAPRDEAAGGESSLCLTLYIRDLFCTESCIHSIVGFRKLV